MKQSVTTIIFSCCLCLLASICKSQTSLSFYHTPELQQTAGFNPAFISAEEKFILSGLPTSGFSISYNDRVALSKVTDLLFEEEVNEVMKDIFRSLVNRRLFFQSGEFGILNFNFTSKVGLFNFVVKDHASLMLDFEGDLSKFLMNSKERSVPFGLSQDFPLEAVHYREYSLGFSRSFFNNRLAAGVRAKFLYGKSYLSSEVSATNRLTATKFDVVSSGKIYMSLPAEREENDDGQFTRIDPLGNSSIFNYLTNNGNRGTAIDFGFSYSIKPNLELSASIINIGKINWKEDTHDMDFGSTYELTRTDVEPEFRNGGIYVSKIDLDVSFDDNIEELFDLLNAEDFSFKRSIPVSYFLGLKYNINENLDLGLVERLISYDNFYFNSLALTVNRKLDERFTVVSGFGVYGDSYINVPLGATYKWYKGQAYLNVENLFSIFSIGVSDYQGVSFGVSFFPFKPKMKYDRVKYLPFFKKKRKKKKTDDGLIFKGEQNSI